MEGIKIFNSPMFGELRVTRNEKGELLFCLKDVCNALDLQRTATKNRLDPKGVSSINLLTSGGEQRSIFINEPNFYRCVFQSRKKTAAAFQDWVFNEVLPSLRKTGGYIVTTATDTPEMIMARALKVADETIKRNEQRMRELEAQSEQQAATIDLQKKELTVAAPKVDYYDNTLASVNYITATQVADDLGVSARALNKKLSEIGLIYFQSGQWHVKGIYRGWNLASTRTHTYQSSNGENISKPTLVWNQRGKRFILALYNNGFNVKSAIAEIKGAQTPTLSNNNK